MIGSALRTAGRRAFASAAHAGENPQWREVYKRTPVYIALILTGAVITEVIFGKFTGLLWRSANRGKLYDDVDWSKFIVVEDPSEEEDY